MNSLPDLSQVRPDRKARFNALTGALIAAGVVTVAGASHAAPATVANPVCPIETVLYNPGNGEDIIVPKGYTVSVFARNLNFPTAVAFRGNRSHFQVFILESGHGLPSRCNDESSPAVGGLFSMTNPFTPDIVVYNESGQKIAGPIGKPTSNGGGLLAHGPSIHIAFERGFEGGRLFVTDSNQAIRTAGAQNNSSRISIVDLNTGDVVPFITGLPTGDHPAEQMAFKGEWIYWSQGSTTNSGVVGRDNGGGTNQHDIPCEDIVLSNNVFDSGGGVMTSGYSDFGTTRPGAHVPAHEGRIDHACDGAILRARIHSANPQATIEPVSWGYRNPYGIRFAPDDHPLKGGLFVTENGEDERGARPANNAPDRLHVVEPSSNGKPDYHGWPDRFGFLDSTQAVFNPVGGPSDDNPQAVVGKPVLPVLASPPQPPVSPLAIEPADVAVVGLDFVPDGFTSDTVHRGAALIGREGDFGFSKGNGEPEQGHDIELVNFSAPGGGGPLRIRQSRFASNTTGDQAFTDGIRGINRPVDLKFGPDECAYLVDYGAVRDVGQSDDETKFKDANDAPLVQIPGTGVVWKICKR